MEVCVFFSSSPMRRTVSGFALYNLIRSLAKSGHQITLATVWSNTQERSVLEELTADGFQILAVPLTRVRSLWNCLGTLPRSSPLQSVYCWQPQLLNDLRAAINDRQSPIDLIHVEHLRGACYGTHLQSAMQRSRFRIPIVWDSVDCISHLFGQAANNTHSLFGRALTRFELPRTRWYEAWLVGRFDRVLVTSDQDRHAFGVLLQAYAPPSNGRIDGIDKMRILPNGVDLHYFTPQDAPRAPQTIILTGKMSYHANVTAALYLVNEIMPLVWERLPSARVQIVGQNAPREISSLARKYPNRVEVTGTVADLRPYLSQATIAAAPITYGAGIQNKVLEAMAMGTPVVATSKAVSALPVRNNEEVLIADNPESFSKEVVRLLRDQRLRKQLAQRGRRYVEQNHGWDGIVERLEKIYLEVIEERRLKD